MEVRKIKTGDVLCASWGWEQTNVDFYRVLKRTPCFVTLQEFGSKVTNNPDKHSMTAEVGPAYVLKGEPVKKKVTLSYHGDEEMVMICHGFARIWDGKPKRTSSYA